MATMLTISAVIAMGCRLGVCKVPKRKRGQWGRQPEGCLPQWSGQHPREGAVGRAVQLGEVPGDGPEHVSLGPRSSSDGPFVMFVRVHRLEDTVRSTSPGCD